MMEVSAEKTRHDGEAAAQLHFSAGKDADPTPPADVAEWLQSSWRTGYMTRWRLLQRDA